MHIGKTHNIDICSDLTIDAWKEEISEDFNGRKVLTDKYDGKTVMENVSVKKYLGDLISSDGKNLKNIEERTNKSFGNVDKIVATLNERPFGKH